MEIVIVIFACIVGPINLFSFNLKALENLYIVRTRMEHLTLPSYKHSPSVNRPFSAQSNKSYITSGS